jgi:hypothetical protein
MPTIPDPIRVETLPADAIKAAAAADALFMPDMVYILTRTTSRPPGPPAITGKSIARITSGVNQREVTEAVLQRIANRVSYTVLMPPDAFDKVTPTSMLRLFIKDRSSGLDRVVDNCEVVSVDPGGTYRFRTTVIAVEPATSG